MATHYVDSGATGANDGTSKTDAWVKLSSSFGAGVNDRVFVSHTHSETDSSASFVMDWTGSSTTGPVKVLSIDFSDDSATAGATITIDTDNSWVFAGNMVMRGFTINAVRNFDWSGDSDGVMHFLDCNFIRTEVSASGNDVDFGGVDISYQFTNCTFDISTSSGTFAFSITNNGGEVLFTNCDFLLASSSAQYFHINSTRHSDVRFYGCDFTNDDPALYFDVDGGSHVVIERSSFHANFDTGSDITMGTSTASGGNFQILNCTAGTTSTTPFGLYAYATHKGAAWVTTSKYRTSGADDGEQVNAYSWRMDANASAVVWYFPLKMHVPLTRWVDSGSQTITIFIAGGATLNDDDFWVELHSPNETANPNTTSRGRIQTSRGDWHGTPAALTTDGDSTWNGTGVGTKQKVTFTINPADPGPISAYLYFAKPSSTVYVDPLIDVT